jgi:hypothetical protein
VEVKPLIEKRLAEIRDKYEHLVWRNDMEAELLRVIGELVETVEEQQKELEAWRNDFMPI